ncbi:hypothetical protein D3C75_1248180 [compost metagenome]
MIGLGHHAYAALNRLCCPPHGVYRLRNPRNHVAHQRRNFRRLPMGFIRQLPHLFGYHTEAPAMFPRPCRFNSRIKCQQIGLLGNCVDRANDGGYLV